VSSTDTTIALEPWSLVVNCNTRDRSVIASIASIALLSCAADKNRIVQVVVWDTIKDHAIAVGWKQPLGAYDRAKMLGDMLDPIISQASERYDAMGKQTVVELRDGPSAGREGK
jgi:hypothetical protein